MNLAIDIGNTRTKIGLFLDGILQEIIINDALETINLPALIQKYAIKKAIISSTKDIPNQLLNDFAQLPKAIILTEDTRLPFANLYATPKTLGKDRLALIAAGQAQFPNHDTLIIGCGTCITFNFINHKGAFLGGSIHPGLKMRLLAMHTFTDKLPLVALQDNAALFGNDTITSLLSGTLYATAREIDGMLDEYLVKFPKMKIIITGGDADLLVYRLKNQIFAISNLTLIGLNHILDYNA